MLSKDLRIGNLVHYNGNHNEVGTITKISSELFPECEYVGIDNVININYLIKHIKPIPITEEWLLKFGFEEKGWNSYDKGMFRFHAQGKKGNEFYNTEFYVKGNLISFKIEFVHQLQNIVFAITQTELTTK